MARPRSALLRGQLRHHPIAPAGRGVLRACFLSGISGWFSLSLGPRGCRRIWRGEKWLRRRDVLNLVLLISGRVNLFCHPNARARAFPKFSVPALLDSDRAAWAVQRWLAAAARRSATGSASPRPDRTSWPGVLRRAFSPRHFGLVLLIPSAAWVPKNLARRKTRRLLTNRLC